MSRMHHRLCFFCCNLCAVFCILVPTSAWAELDPVALFESGKFSAARKAFLDVLDRSPDDPQALFYLGRLSSEGAVSRRFFERLLSKHPSHKLVEDALFELAEADFADPSGRYLSAQKRFRRLLDQFPQKRYAAMAHYRIGLTFLVLNEAEPALAAFDAAKRLGASDAAQLARLGTLEALVLKGQKVDALRAAEDWLVEGAGDLDADVKAFVSRLSGKPNPRSGSEAGNGRRLLGSRGGFFSGEQRADAERAFGKSGFSRGGDAAFGFQVKARFCGALCFAGPGESR